MTARWELKLDAFPEDDEAILLPRPPLQGVISVTYLDEAGAIQTWASSKYSVSKPVAERAAFGSLEPAYGESYPDTRDVRNAVSILFDAGYGAGGQTPVPASIKSAILLGLGDLYEHREESITGTIVSRLGAFRALLDSFRMRRVPE